MALRDWIESRLPQTLGPTRSELLSLETSLQVQLQIAGLSGPKLPDSDDPTPGSVGLKFEWLPELPNTLIVVGSVSVRCGQDDAVYIYQFHPEGRTRTIENHPQSNWGFEGPKFQLSDPDSQGRRMLLIHSMSVQCASSWMQMDYSVFRVGDEPNSSELLFTDKHSFWLGDGPEFVFNPDEVIIQFVDSGVDGERRTAIHRYRVASGVQRLDPVALLPEDFAGEWLTRPWSEMESRSAADTKAWHQQLHAEYVFGEYERVIRCASVGQWLIGLDIMHIGDKELSDPPPTYFLVHDLGNYTYNMEAVSTSPPTGCAGEGFASDKHPWLSTAELKALR